MAEYKTKEQKAKFYNSGKWKLLRLQAMKRDNNECQICKQQGFVTIDTNIKREDDRKKIEIVVHHMKEIEDYPQLALDIRNLQTLCVSCHNEIHGRTFERKSQVWDDERW